MPTLIEQLKKSACNQISSDERRRQLPLPATLSEVSFCERVLGFTLPKLLRDCYIEVGNGGFGPGHNGIFGLPSAAVLWGGHSSVEWYLALRSKHGPQEPEWPEGLLPICDWGDSIMSSIDCSKPYAPVIRHDPSWSFEEIRARLQQNQIFDGDGRLFEATWIEMQTLEEWLLTWIEQKDIFHMAYSWVK